MRFVKNREVEFAKHPEEAPPKGIIEEVAKDYSWMFVKVGEHQLLTFNKENLGYDEECEFQLDFRCNPWK